MKALLLMVGIIKWTEGNLCIANDHLVTTERRAFWTVKPTQWKAAKGKGKSLEDIT